MPSLWIEPKYLFSAEKTLVTVAALKSRANRVLPSLDSNPVSRAIHGRFTDVPMSLISTIVFLLNAKGPCGPLLVRVSESFNVVECRACISSTAAEHDPHLDR